MTELTVTDTPTLCPTKQTQTTHYFPVASRYCPPILIHSWPADPVDATREVEDWSDSKSNAVVGTVAAVFWTTLGIIATGVGYGLAVTAATATTIVVLKFLGPVVLLCVLYAIYKGLQHNTELQNLIKEMRGKFGL